MKEYSSKILIIDDDRQICTILRDLVKREGFEPVMVHEGEEALKVIRLELPDLALVDLMLPGIDGMEVLRQIRGLDPELPVVFITAHGDARSAVQAIRAGAHDFLSKPFDNNEVLRVVHRALAERKLKVKVRQLTNQVSNISLEGKMGPSDAVAQLISQVDRVAESDFTVIIIGETGSGKEVVARAIHDASPRSRAPFIPVDCGAIPETLLESELFGHEKGAFTGAELQKLGILEVANGGTIFLDEISNMPLGSQAKLLRILQEKKVYRVGGTKPISLNFRLLVASNLDLHEQARSGSFRRDLFYRLNEFSIAVPPLRGRKEDIPYLAKRFLDQANVELNKHITGFSEPALNILLNHNWPGNVRQLRSAIRRAALLADELIVEKHLDLEREHAPAIASSPKIQATTWGNLTLKEILRQSITELERDVLSQVLRTTGGNKAKAARLLHIDYKTIHHKIKRLGIRIEKGNEYNQGNYVSLADGAKTPQERLKDLSFHRNMPVSI